MIPAELHLQATVEWAGEDFDDRVRAAIGGLQLAARRAGVPSPTIYRTDMADRGQTVLFVLASFDLSKDP